MFLIFDFGIDGGLKNIVEDLAPKADYMTHRKNQDCRINKAVNISISNSYY